VAGRLARAVSQGTDPVRHTRCFYQPSRKQLLDGYEHRSEPEGLDDALTVDDLFEIHDSKFVLSSLPRIWSD